MTTTQNEQLANETHLKDRDMTILLDSSTSMDTKDHGQSKTRWQQGEEVVTGLAKVMSKYDTDGITLVTFASKTKRFDNVQPSTVQNVFREVEPNGSTNLALALKETFQSYETRKSQGKTKANGELVAIFTDGVPDNEEAVENEIINFTKKLANDGEFGIQIIQVGKEPSAAQYLKRLDDGLKAKGAKWDIVDTMSFEDIGDRPLVDSLLSALND